MFQRGEEGGLAEGLTGKGTAKVVAVTAEGCDSVKGGAGSEAV